MQVKRSSNGANTDGTSMNTGNKLGSRPTVRLYPQYNDSSAMDAILSQADERPPASGIGHLELEATHDEPAQQPPPRTQATHPTELDIQWRQQRLLDAIANNKVKEVRVAVEDGADINRADSAGLTPLHVAAKAGRPRVTELLLELGADPKVRTKSGTPADVAATDELRSLLRA